jgi:hypothetical protein
MTIQERPSARSASRERQWYEKPFPLALYGLAEIRNEMRRKNLVDTNVIAGEATRRAVAAGELPWHRSYDGSGYDAADVDMGRAWTRFDRNLALEAIGSSYGLMDPSPRAVSDRFRPASIINVLAAAWIQFENHDWFFHGESPKDEPYEVPLAEEDSWTERPMCVRRTMPDPTHAVGDGSPGTFVNTQTHWWDGAQVYGSSEARNRSLRTGEGGRLALDELRRPPAESDPALHGIDLTGFNENYWAGLALLHRLFAR